MRPSVQKEDTKARLKSALRTRLRAARWWLHPPNGQNAVPKVGQASRLPPVPLALELSTGEKPLGESGRKRAPGRWKAGASGCHYGVRGSVARR